VQIEPDSTMGTPGNTAVPGEWIFEGKTVIAADYSVFMN
jgi:hypothetical protein